jgi:hypothetical protein
MILSSCSCCSCARAEAGVGAADANLRVATIVVMLYRGWRKSYSVEGCLFWPSQRAFP